MSIIIRKAEDKDAAEIVRCMKKLAEFEHLSDSCRITPEGLTELMHEPNGLRAAIAEKDGITAGMMAYHLYKIATFSGKRVLYIEDIFVEEEFRRQGIAKQFFRLAEKTAKEEGCARVEWKCLEWNENAKALYDKVGTLSSDEWLTYTIDI